MTLNYSNCNWAFTLVLFLFISCNQKARMKPYDKTVSFSAPKHIDTSLFAIIPIEKFQFVFDSSYKDASLTNNDLLEIDSLLNKCVNDYNNSLSKEVSNFRISTIDYRQYIAAINTKGEKEVWINCFCKTNNIDWKKSVVGVEDGGGCYYHLKINLATKKYYNLSVNGEA
jgi:hypothetical protein